VKIRLHHDSELPWTRIGDMSKDPSVLTEEGINSKIRSHELGTDTDPQLSEVDYAANVSVAPHSHDVAEIIYVVEGELKLGSTVLGRGSSVFIDKDAVYSFRTGEQGLKMLIFRPRGGASTYAKGRKLGD
jgi:quercetin dioxygenase-like cupin family protein